MGGVAKVKVESSSKSKVKVVQGQCRKISGEGTFIGPSLFHYFLIISYIRNVQENVNQLNQISRKVNNLS